MLLWLIYHVSSREMASCLACMKTGAKFNTNNDDSWCEYPNHYIWCLKIEFTTILLCGSVHTNWYQSTCTLLTLSSNTTYQLFSNNRWFPRDTLVLKIAPWDKSPFGYFIVLVVPRVHVFCHLHVMVYEYTKAELIWSIFCRRHFQTHFLEWKTLNFH